MAVGENRQLKHEPGSLVLEIQAGLKRLERRDWFMWVGAVVVMLVLTLAVVSLTLPSLFPGEDSFFRFNMRQAVRGLVALVLLFNVYTIYQQILIKRLRRQLAVQLEAVVELSGRADEFHKLSVQDPLTGLYNRRFADQRLTEEISRSERQGHPLSVLMIDLDRFKQVNDKLGHMAGDTVLKEFSERLRRAVRYSDLPVRAGGDEFMVILTDCRVDQVQMLVNRLEGMEVDFQGEKIPVTFSAGCTGFHKGETAEELVHRADVALYENKRAGRAGVEAAPVAG